MGARRIAVIAYHSSPLQEPGQADAGGMTIYVREVAGALACLGIETDIFTRAMHHLPRIAQLGPGVRAVSIHAGPPGISKEEGARFVSDFAAGVRSFARADGQRYDVVHSHYWQSGLAAMPLARSWGVPLVHSSHTLGRVKNGALPPGDVLESEKRGEAEGQVVRAADVVVASTHHEREELTRLYEARQDTLRTIHPGVDHHLFRPGDKAEARARLGLDAQAPVLLAVGRIQPLKGLSLVLEALARIAPMRMPPLLLIVGGPSGPRGEEEVAHLKKLARSLRVASRVRWLGPRPQMELPAMYRAADALMVCSYSESFGLAALEAHACGTPVFGTAVGGLSYVVKDGRSGFLFPGRDPVVFADRLGSVLSNPALHRDLSLGAVRAARPFSWSVTARALLVLYDRLIDEPLPQTRVG